MQSNPAAYYIAQAALKAGSNPLKALGIDDTLPYTVDMATFVFEMAMPRGEEMTEREADEATDESLSEMLREEAWEDATDPEAVNEYGGYSGPRGVTPPDAVPTLYPLLDPEAPPKVADVWDSPLNYCPLYLALPGPYRLTVDTHPAGGGTVEV